MSELLLSINLLFSVSLFSDILLLSFICYFFVFLVSTRFFGVCKVYSSLIRQLLYKTLYSDRDEDSK